MAISELYLSEEDMNLYKLTGSITQAKNVSRDKQPMYEFNLIEDNGGK